MLLNKAITTGEVVSIKLISGEEIISRIDEEHTDHIVLSRPLSVSIGPNGLGMMPFMFLNSSNTVNIKQSHIIAMGVAKKEASDQYIQGTTGIALA
jgi:hypothetical protein